MTYTQKFDYLVDNGIATVDEITLVVQINGHTKEQLDRILFARTGYTSFESFDHHEMDDSLAGEDYDDNDYLKI